MEEKTNVLESGIKEHFGIITVDEVRPSLNPNKLTAQVRQLVMREYPGARGHDSLSDGLFENDEFAVEGAAGRIYESQRVAFIDIPLKDKEGNAMTKEKVEAKLDQLECPKLVRFYSLDVILSEQQRASMKNGINQKTIEQYRKTQSIKDNDGNEVPWQSPDGTEYEQYGITKFSKTHIPDKDSRLSEWQENKGENAVRVEVAEGAEKEAEVPA